MSAMNTLVHPSHGYTQEGGVPVNALGRRLAATGYAAAWIGLFVPVVTLFVLEVTFIPLTIVTVGIFALQLIVPATAAIATAHRKIAARILGRPVEPFYKPTDGLGVLGRLQRWAGDGARWRDLAWLFVATTVGF